MSDPNNCTLIIDLWHRGLRPTLPEKGASWHPCISESHGLLVASAVLIPLCCCICCVVVSRASSQIGDSNTAEAQRRKKRLVVPIIGISLASMMAGFT